jgi:hypothetical protein
MTTEDSDWRLRIRGYLDRFKFHIRKGFEYTVNDCVKMVPLPQNEPEVLSLVVLNMLAGTVETVVALSGNDETTEEHVIADIRELFAESRKNKARDLISMKPPLPLFGEGRTRRRDDEPKQPA